MTPFRQIWQTMNRGDRVTLLSGFTLLAVGGLAMGLQLPIGPTALAAGMGGCALAFAQYAARNIVPLAAATKKLATEQTRHYDALNGHQDVLEAYDERITALADDTSGYVERLNVLEITAKRHDERLAPLDTAPPTPRSKK